MIYKLKQPDLALEGNHHIIELLYRDKIVYLYLKDGHDNVIKVYDFTWLDTKNLPAPLDSGHRFKGVVIDKQHIKEG